MKENKKEAILDHIDSLLYEYESCLDDGEKMVYTEWVIDGLKDLKKEAMEDN